MLDGLRTYAWVDDCWSHATPIRRYEVPYAVYSKWTWDLSSKGFSSRTVNASVALMGLPENAVTIGEGCGADTGPDRRPAMQANEAEESTHGELPPIYV